MSPKCKCFQMETTQKMAELWEPLLQFSAHFSSLGLLHLLESGTARESFMAAFTQPLLYQVTRGACGSCRTITEVMVGQWKNEPSLVENSSYVNESSCLEHERVSYFAMLEAFYKVLLIHQTHLQGLQAASVFLFNLATYWCYTYQETCFCKDITNILVREVLFPGHFTGCLCLLLTNGYSLLLYFLSELALIQLQGKGFSFCRFPLKKQIKFRDIFKTGR